MNVQQWRKFTIQVTEPSKIEGTIWVVVKLKGINVGSFDVIGDRKISRDWPKHMIDTSHMIF